MIVDFTPLDGPCKKCNFTKETSHPHHKEYCRLFQDAVRKLDWFPRNVATRKRDTEEALLNIKEAEDDIDRAIHYMVIIGCEYDELVEKAIETGNWQCVPSIKVFTRNYADRALAIGKISMGLYSQILHRNKFDY